MEYKNLFAIVVSVTVSIAVAIFLLRFFAPGLIGLPVDLQLVSSAKEVPPFYENVFRQEDQDPSRYIINDPYTITRSRPLYPDIGGRGPNDLLGFRNLHIPVTADIVVTGDSQTYSENVVIEKSWPFLLKQRLKSNYQEVYSMATGGWDAVRYLEIYPKMLHLKPKITIVAYYTGNDALESFITAYGSERFTELRLNKSIDKSTLPPSPHSWPPPKEHTWSVKFPDGLRTGFTPAHRYRSNLDHPAVDTGYDILLNTAQRIAAMAEENNVLPVFTIIPTKELVYEKKVNQDDFALVDGYNDLQEEYVKLVKAEKKRIEWLSTGIKKIPGAVYVDLLRPLQQAALSADQLYPNNGNGHPFFKGYKLIAQTMYEAISGYTKQKLHDGILLRRNSSTVYTAYLYKDQKLWTFSSQEILKRSGWKIDLSQQVVTASLLQKIEKGGYINENNLHDFMSPSVK